VIRDVANWGVFALPRTVTRHQATHHNGHYFVLRFDAGARIQEQVRATLRLDPRIVRIGGPVRLPDMKLASLRKFGRIQWEQGR
jgi:small subunit ribosomal protein S6